MADKDDFIERQYFCNICKTRHKVKLQKSLSKSHKSYPFSYFYLNGSVSDIISPLYLDTNLNIRGAETTKLDVSDNIFSQDQATQIVQN